MSNSEDKIDIERIVAETGVEKVDVERVLGSLCGWGHNNAWLFSSYVKDDQQQSLRESWHNRDTSAENKSMGE